MKNIERETLCSQISAFLNKYELQHHTVEFSDYPFKVNGLKGIVINPDSLRWSKNDELFFCGRALIGIRDSASNVSSCCRKVINGKAFFNDEQIIHIIIYSIKDEIN